MKEINFINYVIRDTFSNIRDNEMNWIEYIINNELANERLTYLADEFEEETGKNANLTPDSFDNYKYLLRQIKETFKD